MNHQQKLAKLGKLDHKKFVNTVLKPIFDKMGFTQIIKNHPFRDQGIDSLFQYPNVLGENEFLALTIWTGKQQKLFPGKAAGMGNLSKLQESIVQHINREVKAPDANRNRLKYIAPFRFLIVSPGIIRMNTIREIRESLEPAEMNSSVDFFDGRKIADLIEEYLPHYFFEEMDYIISYCREVKNDFCPACCSFPIAERNEPVYIAPKLYEKILKPDPGSGSNDTLLIREPLAINGREWQSTSLLGNGRLVDMAWALKKYKRLVITGNPGVGKTTLLRQLVVDLCNKNIDSRERVVLPVPVVLREYFQAGLALRNYLDLVLEKYSFPEARDFMEDDLTRGKVMLLLDGFDELALPGNQEAVLQEIHNFAELYPRCPMVVTSSVCGYHYELLGFTRLELMEFNDMQIERLLSALSPEGNLEKCGALKKAIKENEKIMKMARSPLLLTIINQIFQHAGSLPQNRARLYLSMVDFMLNHEGAGNGESLLFPAEVKRFLLCKLAHENHKGYGIFMKKSFILGVFRRYLPGLNLDQGEAETVFQEILSRHCLIRDMGERGYCFIHLSFQEYLTAGELSEQANGVSLLLSQYGNPWWEEVILFFSGLMQDSGSLVRKIQEVFPEDIFYSNLMLCGKCIAKAHYIDPDLEKEITMDLWGLYVNGDFLLLKEMALSVLRTLKSDHVILDLTHKLEDQDSEVRWLAAEALGFIGNKDSIQSLKQALNDEGKSVAGNVKDKAFEALLKISRRTQVRIPR